ncbi:MAG: alpha/beta fold hydrolase [Acidimicrobiales bacterium]
MSIHHVRGAEIALDRVGTGPRLVWGHGLTMSRAADDLAGTIDWGQVPADLVRYDARGHGESTTTPELSDYGWDALAQDQLELTEQLGIETYLSGGASMGCATALHAAVAKPGRIAGLILMIPPTGWETRAAQTAQYLTSAEVVEHKGVEPMISARRAMAPPDPYVGDEAYHDRRDEVLRAWDTARLAVALRGAASADLPSRDAIASIAVPTLILAWTGDPGHPMSTAEELHRLIPGSTLSVASTAADLNDWTRQITNFVSMY